MPLSPKSEPHTHEYVEQPPRKIPLYGFPEGSAAHGGGLVGFDILQSRKCICGAIHLYGRQRQIVDEPDTQSNGDK